MSRPGDGDEAGTLLHLDANGGSLGVTVPRAADGGPLHPVDVLDQPGGLVVADRELGLL